MTAFVLGATGFVGREVVRLARELRVRPAPIAAGAAAQPGGQPDGRAPSTAPATTISLTDAAFPHGKASSPLPFVSVVIPVYNDADRLALCLRALEAQTYPRERFEIVVADNGSTDHVSAIIREVANVVLVRVIDDTARHAGQADILREAIDGAAGLNPTYPNLPGDDFDWDAYRARLTAIADGFAPAS